MMGVLSCADVSGDYAGTASSSHSPETRVNVSIRIRQTWTNISISLEAPSSRSTSESAAFCESAQGGWELTYTYLNKPKNDAISTMNIHEGTATLIFDPNITSVQGSYYTGRGRVTHGVLTLSERNAAL